MDRKETLLRAAYDLLKKSGESFYVQETLSITVHYDDAECSGDCLMAEIAHELDIEDDA